MYTREQLKNGFSDYDTLSLKFTDAPITQDSYSFPLVVEYAFMKLQRKGTDVVVIDTFRRYVFSTFEYVGSTY